VSTGPRPASDPYTTNQHSSGTNGTSKDLVMAKIRAAIRDDGPSVPIPREYIRRGAHDPGSEHVIELLIDRLVDYRALVDRVSASDLPGAVDDALAGTTHVIVANGLDPVVAQACARNGRVVTIDSAPNALTAQELDAVDVVVTSARVAIALTGTIVLDGGPGQGRRAITLVPDRHVIVLTADQIVETVTEAIGLLDPIAPLTMIAGPSATSDIELERVEGVHGPRTLHVVIVG
jgi:L-lactate dehydrogenase complex protein LldG